MLVVTGSWKEMRMLGVGVQEGSQGVRTQQGKGSVAASLKAGQGGGSSNEEEDGHLKRQHS